MSIISMVNPGHALVWYNKCARMVLKMGHKAAIETVVEMVIVILKTAISLTVSITLQAKNSAGYVK